MKVDGQKSTWRASKPLTVKLPTCQSIWDFLEEMFSEKNEKLIDLNLAVIHYLMKALIFRQKRFFSPT